MGIDPLLKNIERNPMIRSIRKHNFTWPKAYGYADDISLLVLNDHATIRAIFKEYERFSTTSGLFLNADKTEFLRIGDIGPNNIVVTYNGDTVRLDSIERIKINGIWLHNHYKTMQDINYSEISDTIDKQFTAWSQRSLSILGKIQIVKTFGLSQIFFTTSTIALTEEQHNLIRKKSLNLFGPSITYSSANLPTESQEKPYLQT